MIQSKELVGGSERREAPMLQPSMGLDPDRFSLLKKPLR
jgi:uncharacterized protein